MNIQDAVERLEDWGELEGSETGRGWSSLAALWSEREQFSTRFVEALSDELIAQAQYAEHTHIERVREVVRTHIVRELEFVG